MRDTPHRAPCPKHPCSPSYPVSPAAQWACVPCPVHDNNSGGSDYYDNGEYGHDPLFYDPRRRVTLRSPEERAKQHLARKTKYGKLYDSHIHERRLRDQWNLEHKVDGEPSGTTRGQQPLKAVGSTRAPLPAFAGPQAATSKEKPGNSRRHPSASSPRQAGPPALGHRGEWQQQQPVLVRQPRALPVQVPSVSKPARKHAPVPDAIPSKHQAAAKVHEAPSAAAPRRASAPSLPAVSKIQERAKVERVTSRKKTPAGEKEEIEKHRKARPSHSKPESSESSQLKKKPKKKKKHRDDAISVSTPTGPFSPGTKSVKKSHKALKKAQELWQYSQFVGTFCLIFEIVGTIVILLAAFYWLIPRPDEEPITKMHFGDEYGDRMPPLMPSRHFHDVEAKNVSIQQQIRR